MTDRAVPARFTDQRLLVMYACFWLLGSWSWMLYQDGAVASVRWMVISAAIGLMLLWPAWRLSQPLSPTVDSTRAVLMDWLCLELVLQIAIWPLRLTADWSLARTAAIVGVLAVWPLVTAAVIAWAWPRQARRIGMILCVLLIFVWPVAEAFGLLPSFAAAWSPLAWTWNLSASNPSVYP